MVSGWRETLDAGAALTVWGVLREDTYETGLGDGYYAYLERAFVNEVDAEAFAATTQEHMIRWHVRRYVLSRSGEEVIISPEPTRTEPVRASDVLAMLAQSTPPDEEGIS